jgi:putative ABC transport system permease protein
MGAVRLKTVADLRRRRLQSFGLAFVLLLSSATATLAVSILVESHAPFEHAFDTANGAHLILRFRSNVTPDQLAATTTTSTVTASAGPWPVAEGVVGQRKLGPVIGAQLSGRPRPDPSIDNITVQEGRWWQAPGEAVLDLSTARMLDKHVGDVVTVFPSPFGPTGEAGPSGIGTATGRDLTIVGIAGSVSTPDVSAWMSPTDIIVLVPKGSPEQEILYRVTPSQTAADLAAATASITHGLPAGAVGGSQTYLDLEVGVDRLADLYVPVLLAFSVFALLAAAFLIANIVSGVTLTSYRDIGVMKAVGYTPGQVSLVLAGQVLAPAIVGSVIGVTLGTIVSQPVIHDTAESFGLPTAFSLSAPVVVSVLGVALTTCMVAALVPAARAGRISAVDAMTRGLAPSMSPGGGRLRRLGLAAPVGLPGRLGISAGLAHPVRASMMLGALVVGVAAATFALGLNWSLLRVMTDLNRNGASPIRVEAMGPADVDGKTAGPAGLAPGAADGATPLASTTSPADVTAAVAGHPDTAHSVAIGELDVNVPGLAALPFVGYQGDSSWLGFALIEGRWFAGPGEAVAPTNFFTRSGLLLGDMMTITSEGRSVAVKLVGEIFDTPREGEDGLVLRGTWADLAALDPSIQPERWEAQPKAGVDAQAYHSSLQDAVGFGARVFVEGDSSSDASFLLFLSVVALLGIVLVGMSIGGVFNTVLLETRQRTPEVAVLKTIGLTPAQVVAMVIATVVPVGLVAGVVGVPIGLAAQRLVLGYMGEVAAKTRIPAEVYDVFPFLVLVGLGLLGLVIGAIGAYPPAQRAARASIAPVLQAE